MVIISDRSGQSAGKALVISGIIKVMKWLQNIPEHIGWYISGFSDGEGSFNVSFRKGNGHRLGWQVQLTFNVSQRDISNLEMMQQQFGCGRLQHRSDGVHYFVVSDFRSIIDQVIPFFEQFPFFFRFQNKKLLSISGDSNAGKSTPASHSEGIARNNCNSREVE